MNYPISTTKPQNEVGDGLGLGKQQTWLQNSWPEFLSLMAWLWGIEAGAITSMMELIGILLVLPLGIRASWNIATLLHGTGHTLLIAAVDGKSSVLNIESISDHQNLAKFGRSMMPFRSINWPNFSEQRIAVAPCRTSRSMENTHQDNWWFADERHRHDHSDSSDAISNLKNGTT